MSSEIRWGISNLILSQQGIECVFLTLLGNIDDQDGDDEEEEEEDDELKAHHDDFGSRPGEFWWE